MAFPFFGAGPVESGEESSDSKSLSKGIGRFAWLYMGSADAAGLAVVAGTNRRPPASPCGTATTSPSALCI